MGKAWHQRGQLTGTSKPGSCFIIIKLEQVHLHQCPRRTTYRGKPKPKSHCEKYNQKPCQKTASQSFGFCFCVQLSLVRCHNRPLKFQNRQCESCFNLSFFYNVSCSTWSGLDGTLLLSSLIKVWSPSSRAERNRRNTSSSVVLISTIVSSMKFPSSTTMISVTSS